MELSSNSPIVRKFVELAGGKDSVITILPVASDFGNEIGPMYKDAFSELCDDVEYYMIDERNDTENPDCLVRIKKSTGVFFTGGNQLRITALIGGSELLNILNEKIQQGIVIAGTSAGASAMSSTMITWGRSERMTKGNLQMSPGLGFIPNMVLDSHFVKRGRISRLLNNLRRQKWLFLGITQIRYMNIFHLFPKIFRCGIFGHKFKELSIFYEKKKLFQRINLKTDMTLPLVFHQVILIGE